MAKKFTFTKDELTTAFQKWNAEVIDNPDNFKNELQKGRGFAESQANELLKHAGKN